MRRCRVKFRFPSMNPRAAVRCVLRLGHNGGHQAQGTHQLGPGAVAYQVNWVRDEPVAEIFSQAGSRTTIAVHKEASGFMAAPEGTTEDTGERIILGETLEDQALRALQVHQLRRGQTVTKVSAAGTRRRCGAVVPDTRDPIDVGGIDNMRLCGQEAERCMTDGVRTWWRCGEHRDDREPTREE